MAARERERRATLKRDGGRNEDERKNECDWPIGGEENILGTWAPADVAARDREGRETPKREGVREEDAEREK